MMVGLEEGDVAAPASEGLEVLDPGADVDLAREPARVEAGAAGSEDGRPVLGPPSRIHRLVETDLPDDRRCCVAIRRDLAFRVERVHLDLAADVRLPSREAPLAQVQVPLVLGRPADQLAGLDHLPELDDRDDVPVREVADPDDALLGGLLRLPHAPHESALERIDAVRPPRRAPRSRAGRRAPRCRSRGGTAPYGAGRATSRGPGAAGSAGRPASRDSRRRTRASTRPQSRRQDHELRTSDLRHRRGPLVTGDCIEGGRAGQRSSS